MRIIIMLIMGAALVIFGPMSGDQSLQGGGMLILGLAGLSIVIGLLRAAFSR